MPAELAAGLQNTQTADTVVKTEQANAKDVAKACSKAYNKNHNMPYAEIVKPLRGR